MRPATLASIFSPLIVSAEEDENLRDIAVRMRRRDVGSVMVVRGGEFAGILTERDIARAIADGAQPMSTTAREYMTAGALTTVQWDATLFEAARSMIALHIRHLPVIDGARVIGMLSAKDVLAELLS